MEFQTGNFPIRVTELVKTLVGLPMLSWPPILITITYLTFFTCQFLKKIDKRLLYIVLNWLCILILVACGCGLTYELWVRLAYAIVKEVTKAFLETILVIGSMCAIVLIIYYIYMKSLRGATTQSLEVKTNDGSL